MTEAIYAQIKHALLNGNSVIQREFARQKYRSNT
jgi:hypothetical protein